MANFKTYVTDAGRNLLTANIATNTATVFTKAIIGDGRLNGIDPYTITTEINPLFEANLGSKELVTDANGKQACRIPVQITNKGLSNVVYIREITLYAKDNKGNDILFSYTESTDVDDSINSISPPASNVTDANQIRIIDIHVYLTQAEFDNIEVTVSSSALVAWSDVIHYAAPIIHRHQTNEIDNDLDSNGQITTLDRAQKEQWEAIKVLENLIKSKSDQAIQKSIDSKMPLQWKIINERGWYDKIEIAFKG